MNEWVNI